MTKTDITVANTDILPPEAALVVGRIWWPEAAGPALVTWRGDQLVDITAHGPTMSALLDRPDVAAIVREAPGEAVGPVADIVAASLEQPRNDAATYLLAPVDLQAVKAAGVTFASRVRTWVCSSSICSWSLSSLSSTAGIPPPAMAG